jgi:protein-disulfide isomerase
VTRQKRLTQLVSAAIFLAIVVVAALIVVSQSETDAGDTSIEDAGLVKRELAGIPQAGMVLGDPKAKVTVVEFGDLQCPVCKGYSEEVIPQLVSGPVREGEAKLEFRNFVVIGPQSETAGAAAIAAGNQGVGWNYVELFYRNQGIEDSGYAGDEFLTALARAAGVPDIAQWNTDRRSGKTVGMVSATSQQAEEVGFTGTPSFGVEGPGVDGFEPLGLPGSAGEIEAAIEKAS